MTTPTSWIRLVVALAAATAALAPRSVCAQSSADALALFEDGKRLMDKGDLARACEKFEASDRITPGAGTELNLGRCRKENGQLASAWVAFRAAAATAKRRGDIKRASEARRWVAAIEPQLVYLTIAVPEDARVDGLGINRNGTVVDAALWDTRVPVDPDKYTITAEAAGYRPWHKTIVITNRSQKVVVPPLDKQPEPPPAPRREVRSVAAGPDEPSGARESVGGGAEAGTAPSRWTGKRKLSLVLAAVGVVAAGAGVALGMHANSVEARADTLCPNAACDMQPALDLNQTARRYALGANISYATAGAAVVGAAVLWFVGGPSSSGAERAAVIPTLGAGRIGVALARSF